jgi:hypothetical protein
MENGMSKGVRTLADAVTRRLRKNQSLSSGIGPTFSQKNVFLKTLETCVDEHIEWLEAFDVSNVEKRTNDFFDVDDEILQACFEYALYKNDVETLYAFKVCFYVDEARDSKFVLPIVCSQTTIKTPDSCSVEKHVENGVPCNVVDATSFISEALREFFVTKKKELDAAAFGRSEYELE